LKIKYDGFFNPIKNSNQQKYDFGKLMTLSLDSVIITFGELLEELTTTHALQGDQTISLCFQDKTINSQSFI
jgi:hypothetical protein